VLSRYSSVSTFIEPQRAENRMMSVLMAAFVVSSRHDGAEKSLEVGRRRLSKKKKKKAALLTLIMDYGLALIAKNCAILTISAGV
jgi:hypothetical protein